LRLTIPHLFSNHAEVLKCVLAKDHGDRNIPGVTPAPDEDAANPAAVVAWIEGVPVPAKVSLEPCTEIHRVGDRRDADITEIAGSVTSRNIHAAAERYRQVREIAADANPLVKGIERRAVGASFQVIELEMAMDKVANRLNPGPTGWRITEGAPRKIKQFAIDLAVTAGEKK